MTPDAIESILADFRLWLEEARDILPLEEAPELDLATIVQQFTALRHEVNLQTKASRAQLEQNAQAQSLLQEALEAVQNQPAPEEDTADEALRPLLKTLVDAHDSLALARREVQRLLKKPATAPATPHVEIELRLPYWTRWIGLDRTINKQVAKYNRRAAAAVPPSPPFGPMLDALLVGYDMSLQRIERALQHHGLESIPCAGQPFDPETMEVAEVVRDPGRPGAEVIDVLRPGYLLRGRLFRYAQVRVAKP